MGVVSVTDFPPLPRGRRSQVGPSKNVGAVLEVFLRETESLTKARSITVCPASWSVIEVNGVQCFTSSSLSFSSEQLSSKEKKICWINPVPLASFNTGAVEDVLCCCIE